LFQINKGDIIIYCANHRSEWANFLFIYGSQAGEGYVYITAFFVFLFIEYRHALVVFMASATVLILSGLLKELFGHPRPYTYFTEQLQQPYLVNYIDGVTLHKSWTSSFPSGHTTSGFAFYGLIAMIFQKPLIQFLCLVMAFMVGFSRIYLVQHFLEDVTAGMLLGTFIASVLALFHQRLGETNWGKQSLLRRGRRVGK